MELGAVTPNTYRHVLADETELDYAKLLGRDRASTNGSLTCSLTAV